MSSKTKKRLFIALAGLLASSTAAVLVAYPGASGSTSRSSSAQAAAEIEAAEHSDAGCLASVDGVCEFSTPAWANDASFALDFGVDTSFASHSAGIAATHGESAQWQFEDRFSLEDRQLISDITHQLAGAYNIALPQGQYQSTPEGAVSSSRHYNSLRSVAANAGLSGGGSLGTDLGSGSPGGGTPGSGSPDSGSPDGGSPDSGSPDSSSPDSGAPGDGSPGDDSPGSGFPGNGSPGGGAPIGGPDAPVTVPEPGSMGLLAFGLALAAVMRRRRHA